MKHFLFVLLLSTSVLLSIVRAEKSADLKSALTFHASFDKEVNADFSLGDSISYLRQGKENVPTKLNEELKISQGTGKFGNSLWFVKKGNTRPQFNGAKILNYNEKNWSSSTSVWLKLDPDKDLEPGYCDPVQIVGNDYKKGFIFLEWSKDESPRFFRFAIRPLFSIWNPTNVQWADIPFEKRPMVQVKNAPFSKEIWTHVVFSFENINNKNAKPLGKLHINGKLQGKIENWDLTFGWDPAQVSLVLGAAYVGHMDDLALFNRALSDEEVQKIFELKNGVSELYSKKE